MPKILVFKKEEGCPACKNLADYLNSKNVQYEVADPFNNLELALKYGVKGVPTTVIDDERVIVGFNIEKINQELGL